MIHSSFFRPRAFPVNTDAAPNEIDRLQDMAATTNLKREKVYEIGRDDIVDWKQSIPDVSVSLKQMEYGSLDFYNILANKASSNTLLTLNDFKTSITDIAGYSTDDNGTFLSTIWYPKLRVSGFDLSIGDPDAFVERSFNLMGEDEIIWSDNNKYLIYLTSTATGVNHQIVIGSGGFSTYPVPVADPDSSGTVYIQRVVRYRGTTTTELVLTTDYTYNSGTATLTIPSSAASDVYKVWYTAASYITGVEPFVENDSDLASISADSVSIYLNTSNYVYRLQNVGINVSLSRQDVKEIGNFNIVQRGITDKTVKITLGRFLESYTLEQILRGALTTTYGKYDVRRYADNISLVVKVYSDRNKGTFKLGYKFENLSPTTTDAGIPIRDYVKKGATLEGSDCTITNVEASL